MQDKYMIPYQLEHYIIYTILLGKKQKFRDTDAFYLYDGEHAFKEYTGIDERAGEIALYWDLNSFQETYSINQDILKKLKAPILVATYENEQYSDWLIDQNCVLRLS